MSGAEVAEVKAVGPRGPNLNAYVERGGRGGKREGVGRLWGFVVFGEGHLRQQAPPSKETGSWMEVGRWSRRGERRRLRWWDERRRCWKRRPGRGWRAGQRRPGWRRSSGGSP